MSEPQLPINYNAYRWNEVYEMLVAGVQAKIGRWPQNCRSLGHAKCLRFASRPFFQLQFSLALAVAADVGQARVVSLSEFGFLLSWFFHVLDDACDEDALPEDILLAQLVDREIQSWLIDLEPAAPDTRSMFWDASSKVVEALLDERATRLSGDRLAASVLAKQFSRDFLSRRIAPWSFYCAMLASQCGIPEKEASVLQTTWTDLLVIRQIVDDTEDWIQDLSRGRANYFSARLLSLVDGNATVKCSSLASAIDIAYENIEEELRKLYTNLNTQAKQLKSEPFKILLAREEKRHLDGLQCVRSGGSHQIEECCKLLLAYRDAHFSSLST